MEILQINKLNINRIASFIESNKSSCDDLIKNFVGTLLRQVVNKDWVKFIIRSNAAIYSIVIDCQNNKVSAITFSGTLDITYSDLVELYGEAHEYYERYDDTIEFLFKKTNDTGYCIKFYILNGDKKNDWQIMNLENISIHLT